MRQIYVKLPVLETIYLCGILLHTYLHFSSNEIDRRRWRARGALKKKKVEYPSTIFFYSSFFLLRSFFFFTLTLAPSFFSSANFEKLVQRFHRVLFGRGRKENENNAHLNWLSSLGIADKIKEDKLYNIKTIFHPLLYSATIWLSWEFFTVVGWLK